MACFLVPAAEAVFTTIAAKAMKSKERKMEVEKAPAKSAAPEDEGRIPFSKKLGWLNNMLWGGSALLAFEHIWHGEIVPWFPFLTAASGPAGLAGVLQEMSTVGVAMSVLVTAVWAGIAAASSALAKRGQRSLPAENQEA